MSNRGTSEGFRAEKRRLPKDPDVVSIELELFSRK